MVDTPARHDRVRGIGTTVDPLGFVWLHEMWQARSKLQANELRIFRSGFDAD